MTVYSFTKKYLFWLKIYIDGEVFSFGYEIIFISLKCRQLSHCMIILNYHLYKKVGGLFEQAHYHDTEQA